MATNSQPGKAIPGQAQPGSVDAGTSSTVFRKNFNKLGTKIGTKQAK